MRGDRDPAWLLVRIAFTLSTSLIVVVGSLWASGPHHERPAEVLGLSLGLAPFTLVVAAALLLPGLVFLLGVHSPRWVVVFGTLLLGITAGTWALYALNRRESTAGAGIVMGGWWSLISAIVGACMERGGRNDRAAAARGRPAELREPSAQERPRAW